MKVLESSVQKIVLELIYKATSDLFYCNFVLTLIVSTASLHGSVPTRRLQFPLRQNFFNTIHATFFLITYFTTLLEYQQLLTFYTKMNAYGIIKTIQMQKIHKM